MRLFAAIDLNDEARRAIGAEQKRIGEAIGGSRRSALRWVAPDKIHLTLVFLGEIAAEKASQSIEAMRPPIDMPPFDLVLKGLGVFPSHGAPRVLWLGVDEGRAAAIELQREVARRLPSAPPDSHDASFHPHLTLARWREGRSSDRRDALGLDEGRPIARIVVDRVTLYQSQLSSKGPTYAALSVSKLRS
jgi:2'-5' RNA ligase